jgi:hypothetical protein
MFVMICMGASGLEAGPFAYIPVTTSGSDDVSLDKVDLKNGAIVASVLLPVSLQTGASFAVDTVSRRVFIGAIGTTQVLVVDARSMQLVATLTVDEDPSRIIITPRRRRAYIASLCGSVSVVDIKSLIVVDRIVFSAPEPGCPSVHPYALAADASERHLAIGVSDGRIVIVDVTTGASRTLQSSGDHSDLLFNKRGDRLFVLNGRPGGGVMDAATGQLVATFPFSGRAMALDASGKSLAIVGNDQTRVLDSQSLIVQRTIDQLPESPPDDGTFPAGGGGISRFGSRYYVYQCDSEGHLWTFSKTAARLLNGRIFAPSCDQTRGFVAPF